MQLRNHRDLFAGLMFIAFGIGFIVASRDYTMGTAARMGPAFFPTLLGGLLVLLGVLIGAAGFAKKAPALRVDAFQLKPLGLVLGAVALFAWALPTMGLVVSVVALILVASLASHEFRLREAVLSALVLLLMSWLVFAKGLELQFPVLPTFLVAR